MCHQRWQRVVPLALFAVVAFGLGFDLRADDHADHAQNGHADHAQDDAHDHAGDVDHPHGSDAASHDAASHDDEQAHHPDTSLPPIFPNRAMGELFVFSLVFFCLYLVLAKKFAWLPLIAGLDSREARVNRALADAEAARIEAAKLLADHQRQLDGVTEQVKEIVAQARGEAEQEKARIVAEAEAETTAMRDQAIADIHAARQQALEGLDGQIDSQVAAATEHVLG